MKTVIAPIGEDSLFRAKEIIESGGVVAFPTETVYGLGADARNDSAVELIFQTKKRPANNPLIVHVHPEYDISELVEDKQDYTRILRQKFLPGPLTMVYPSKRKVSSLVSRDLDSLAIRVPSHPGAQAFLRYVNAPIAAPSANLSKHVSPVSAEHVFADFNGKIPLILDGGKSEGGIESTVLDCTGQIPTVLRAGLVTREMIAEAVGGCLEYVPQSNEAVPRSPGMMYKHYSPYCRTLLTEDLSSAVAEYERAQAAGERAYLLLGEGLSSLVPDKNVLDLGSTPEQMAANLYTRLREGELVADVIVAVMPQGRGGVMTAFLNRFTKACKGN